MFKQDDSQIDRKWTMTSYASSKKFYGKMSVCFFRKTGKHFFLEVLF